MKEVYLFPNLKNQTTCIEVKLYKCFVLLNCEFTVSSPTTRKYVLPSPFVSSVKAAWLKEQLFSESVAKERLQGMAEFALAASFTRVFYNLRTPVTKRAFLMLK